MKKYFFETKEEYIDILKNADDSYYNSEEASLSDEEYDKIKDEFILRFPDDPYLKTIGSKVSGMGNYVKHKLHMGSQEKVNTLDELSDWADKCFKKVENQDFLVSEKIDGFSLSIEYKNGKIFQAVSRGDGIEGEDVTSNVLKMKQVPHEIKDNFTGFFRGEAVLYLSDFLEHFKDKLNPRNTSAGLIRRLDGERCEHLSFICYDVLSDELDIKTESEKFNKILEYNFITPKFFLLKDVQSVGEIHQKYQTSLRKDALYELDGLIVSLNEIESQKELGIISQRPRYSRAFKFEAEKGETTLQSVSWFVGRTGRITPVAVVEPIKLAGVTITNVTLHNLKEMKKLGVQIGSKIEIKRAGDVIPKVEKCLTQTGEDIVPPSHCPSCSQKTIEEEVFLVCNNKLCPAQNYETLLHFVKTLDVKGFGEELVLKLIDSGLVKEPADYFKLTVKDIAGLERMGEKVAVKVLKILETKKTMTLPVFIKALGIAQISEKTIEAIQPFFHDLNSLSNAKVDELSGIHGIGELTAQSLLTGLDEKKDVISNLLEFVNIEEFKQKAEGFLSGMSFCFTGIRDKNKEQYIKDNGGDIASGVSKNLTYLVAKDVGESSSKIIKATSLGVKLLNYADLENELNSLKGK